MNFLVYYLDDAPIETWDYLPYLRSFPHGSWVSFPRSLLPTPVCTPARVALLTGRYATDTGVIGNVSSAWDKSHSLHKALQDAGYHTGIFGKYTNDEYTEASPMVGWDEWAIFAESRGFYDYDLIENGVRVAYGSTEADYCTDVFAGKAVDFVTSAPEPFFCYVPDYNPHGPSTPAVRHEGLFPGEPPVRAPSWQEDDMSDKPTWLKDKPMLSTTVVNNEDTGRTNTHRSLRSCDEALEDIITALFNRGVLEDTVIVVANDNGRLFGEHRYAGKNLAYEEAIRAALVMVRWPGATQRTEDALVTVADIAPTLVETAGTVLPITPQGMSLKQLIEGGVTSAGFRKDVMIKATQKGGWEGIVTYDDHKQVEWLGGGSFASSAGDVEHYDLISDPYELASGPRSDALRRKLARLRTVLTTTDVAGSGEEPD